MHVTPKRGMHVPIIRGGGGGGGGGRTRGQKQ